MKRKILSMLMVLCMMVSLFPASAFADGDNTLDPLPDAAANTEPGKALEVFSEPEELGIPVPYNEMAYHIIRALEEKNDGLFDYS